VFLTMTMTMAAAVAVPLTLGPDSYLAEVDLRRTVRAIAITATATANITTTTATTVDALRCLTVLALYSSSQRHLLPVSQLISQTSLFTKKEYCQEECRIQPVVSSIPDK
jgi:uncharacterized protein YbcV (DUF1398 family)